MEKETQIHHSSAYSMGEEILKRMEGNQKVSLFSKDFWYGSIMDWSMKNESFKTQMFRFVDVLPSLKSSSEVAKHLKEYFAQGEELPSIFNVGLGLGSLAPSLMAGAIRKNVVQMAKMFITGENAHEALTVLKKSRKNKIAFTVDILGEATLSEKEAFEYQKRYLDLMDQLSEDSLNWGDIPLLDRNHLGPIPKVNVSIKMTALYSQINDKDWENTKKVLKDRLRPLFLKGKERNIFVNLDMEQYSVKHLTLEVFKELIIEPELSQYSHFGCVIQTYLRDSLSDIQDLTQFAKQRKVPFTIRLVKGAYWDYETIEAEQRCWPVPVYTNKQESDANYELCTEYLLEQNTSIHVAFGSHNVRSIAFALVTAERLKIPKEALEVQMLYGMAEPIKKSLIEMGYRVREYAPVGDLLPGMAYLVRRLLENTSNESWLRGKFAEGQSTLQLLKDPRVNLVNSPSFLKKKNHFYNEPLKDFAIKENRDNLINSIAEFKKKLNQNKSPFIVKPFIQGKYLEIENTTPTSSAHTVNKILTRENPSAPSEMIATIHLSTIENAEAAIQSAHSALLAWKKTSVLDRAQKIEQLADLMCRDRFHLIATQIMEVGKPWSEADGDVAEAIDFCRYYAQQMKEISSPRVFGSVAGENSIYHYQARGITAVIAPWNFPLAILTGMAVSALVTGNTVIMKPAEQSSLVAQGLMDLLVEVGFPSGVVQFLPGLGEEIGAYLVQHPLIATIAFTGSKTVGLHILKEAAEVKQGQKHVKRCIIEMGGKNALIIDNDADLDEAVDGVLHSAFGFSGQKCSAASRAIVLDEVYDKFVERLKEATKSIEICSAEDPRSYMGPVVDQEAYLRIINTIKDAKSKYKLIFEGELPQHLIGIGGYYVPPTIFGPVDPHSPWAQEEIFGPVLVIIRVKDMCEALKVANDTQYALTGGLYSRSPAHIEKAKSEFECGNLYINRGITGAMVNRHPFGGFKMSGIGSKTGGPDYLLQYMEPRCITENTMRRGFAPVSD